MNWTDEEIDKLFQESASQMNVPYQDTFWTEMEALLPEKEKKKGLGWIFGGALTCLGLIAAMIFPISHFSVPAAKNTAANNSNLIQLSTENNNTFVHNGSTQLINSSETVNSQGQKAGTVPASIATQNTIKSKYIQTVSSDLTQQTIPTDNMTVLAGPDQNKQPDLSSTDENLLTDLTADETRLALLTMPSNGLQPENGKFGIINPRAGRKQFYAQIGFGVSQSYISGSDGNWMPALNLGAGYQFRPQGFGFSAGLNIQSALSSNLEFTRRSKVYNFGSTNYEQNFRYKQLYSIELPVSIDFRKSKHIVSVGLAPTYLATTVMRFSQSENGELAENRNYIGQRTGMNSFGLKPSLSYQVEINQSWHLGIQLSAQVIKQIDHTQFIGEYTKLPLNGQITIRKTIMR